MYISKNLYSPICTHQRKKRSKEKMYLTSSVHRFAISYFLKQNITINAPMNTYRFITDQLNYRIRFRKTN